MFAPAFYLTLATALSVAAVASPLATRSGSERVFLANCYDGYPGSEMQYYASDAESFTGQQPDDIAFIGPQAAVITPFEGRTISGTFESGDVFTSVIAAGADSLAPNEFAGTGSNDYTNFNCYRDNGRQLFSAIWGEYTQVCYSEYYCKDVSFLYRVGCSYLTDFHRLNPLTITSNEDKVSVMRGCY
jgi:hypothetical protein